MAMGPIDFFVFALFIAVALFLAFFGTRARRVEITRVEKSVNAGFPGTTGRNDAEVPWKRRSFMLFAMTAIFIVCATTVMLGFILAGLTVAAAVLTAATVFAGARTPIR